MANIDMLQEELHANAGELPDRLLRQSMELLGDVKGGTERIRKIVRGMKTFSRVEEDRRSLIDVRTTIELSIDMAFNEIRHRARLVKDYGDTPPVLADDARLGQVFINLLVNAAQAIVDGDVANNEIRVVTSTDAHGDAVIEVRDTGRGIPAVAMEHIFDPFFTTKAVGEGTGLGLSICHSIITSLSGSITVLSREGIGTTVRVVLPRVKQAITTKPTPAIPTVREVLTASVLILDDEPIVGMTLKRILRDHDVVVAQRGREALALIEAGNSFDVIFSDLMMPEMSGMDFYNELKRAHPGLLDRVVFITGGAFSAATHEFFDSVPNERLEKPFDAKTVREVVNRYAT